MPGLGGSGNTLTIAPRIGAKIQGASRRPHGPATIQSSPFASYEEPTDQVLPTLLRPEGCRREKERLEARPGGLDAVLHERSDECVISVVAPFLNEEGCIREFVTRVRRAVQSSGHRYEILLVDDGSSDATPQRIVAERALDPQVKSLRFSRCFGHQAAICAGLRYATGDCVITMDGDLQHPPEVLPDLIREWKDGADVVNAVRRDAPGRRLSWSERAGRRFYGIMNSVSNTPVLATSGDFRLLDRRAVDAFNGLEEHFVFIRGLVPWLGFEERRVVYEIADRFAGERSYSLASMLRLAMDGIFSFSIVPLRLITLLGLVTTAFGVLYGIFSITAFFLGAVEDGGWTSLAVLILVFGGVQLLSIGIASEYIGRIYEEAKHRPRYIISSAEGVDGA